MSKDDKAALWAPRVTKLKEKVEAGEERLEMTNAAASQLIAEEASDTNIAEAKRDAQAADVDLTHLRRALVDAQQALEEAKAAEEVEGVRTRAAHIKKLQSRRAKLLEEAEIAFKQFIAKIEDSERLAVQLHQAAGGCRTVGEALNNRYGPMAGWFITRLLEVIPVSEHAIGQTVANLNHARQQFEGKAFADLQSDYAEMFRLFHNPKVEKVRPPKEKSIHNLAMEEAEAAA
jgi:hypothetical protein